MIHYRTSFVASILLVILVSVSSAYAQTQQDKATPETEETAALREKAFKLLESVAGQLNTLQSAENRARLGANVVDSLWKHDQERARAMLRVVQEDIKTELQKEDKESQHDPRYAVFFKLRHDTVERIAKHDAEAALEFLKVTEPIIKDSSYGYRESEKELQLRLAKQVAASNPDIALKLGREALKEGLSRNLLLLLTKLNRKHRDKGQVLYKEIVEKFRDANLADDWSVRYVSQSLVQTFQPPDADASTYRELIGILTDKAVANGCVNKLPEEDPRAGFCFWVISAIRNAEKYDSRIGRMQHWVSEGYEAHGMSLAYEEIEELLQEANWDQLEALATKYPDLQDVISMRALQHARKTADLDRVKKMIDGFVVDPARQQERAAQIEHAKKRAAAGVTEERLAEIQRSLQELPHVKNQAWFLLTQAHQIGATDQKIALKLIAQAGELIEGMKPGRDQTESRLVLAVTYCFEKNDRAFAIMEAMVPKLNELVEVAVKLDGYDTNYLRDGEWNMSANGTIGELLTNLAQGAGYFAWLDFDRAVSLASQFERPEIRMMAHVKLAQGILAGPPARFDDY